MNDIDQPGAEPTPGWCSAASRAGLSVEARAWLAAGNFTAVVDAGRRGPKGKEWFRIFAHTRSYWAFSACKQKFDWVMSGTHFKAAKKNKFFGERSPAFVPDPRTIFIPPNKGNIYELSALWDAVEAGLPPLREHGEPFRVLVVGGTDHHLTARLSWLNRFRASRRFARIAFEAYDDVGGARYPGVSTMPHIFNTDYTKKHGPSTIAAALFAAKPHSAREQVPDRAILAAWSKRWPELDKTVPSRRELAEWTASTKLTSRTDVPYAEWWKTLTKYRFQVCPTGAGIQSPKVYEAILAGVIPIVQRERAYVEMAQWGFPLAIVTRWNEITEDRLRAWSAELGPRLAVAQWMALSEVWFAFVTQPCPISTIDDFLRGLGLAPSVFPPSRRG